MHRLCIILVVIGSVFGQEKQDVLKLKNGSTYNGEFDEPNYVNSQQMSLLIGVN